MLRRVLIVIGGCAVVLAVVMVALVPAVSVKPVFAARVGGSLSACTLRVTTTVLELLMPSVA